MHQTKILFGLLWQKLAIFAAVLAAAFSLLFYRLDRPSLLSGKEINTVFDSQNIHRLLHNPLNAPYNLIEHFILSYHNTIVFARLTGVIIGIAVVLLFFFILKFWLSIYYALAGSLMFASTSWFLHTARFNSPNILLLLILAPLACGLWLKHSHKRGLVILVSAVVIGLSLYVPGLVWFILAGILIQNRTLIHELKHTVKWVPIMALLIFIIIISPLGWWLIQHPANFKLFIGIPRTINWDWKLLLNLARVPGEVFVRGSINPATWLGHIPLLNVFESVMVVLGIYTFWQNRKLDRTRVVAIAIAISLFLITLNGPSELTLLLPFMYMLMAAGLVYMWDLWHGVFPTNPVAKSTGIIILVVAILFSCTYHLREYYVAWPNNPQTLTAYSQKLPQI
jgi:hypothetical protein